MSLSRLSTTHAATPLSVWPVLMGVFLLSLTALIAGVLFFHSRPSPLQPSVARDDLSIAGRAETSRKESGDQPRDLKRSEPDGDQPFPDFAEGERQSTEEPLTQQEKNPEEVPEIYKRIADWRYIGFMKAPSKITAVVQRMREPGQRVYLAEGKVLEGVQVAEVTPDLLTVSLDGQSAEIPLTGGPGFDPSGVEIPEELAEDPDSLVAIVFAQTLGMYLAEEPETPLPEGNAVEPEIESVEALSARQGWPPPSQGETFEEWATRTAESFPTRSDPSGSSNPLDYPLAEEDRMRILGMPTP